MTMKARRAPVRKNSQPSLNATVANRITNESLVACALSPISAGLSATRVNASTRIGGDRPRRIRALRTTKSVAIPAAQATSWAIRSCTLGDCHGLRFQSPATGTWYSFGWKPSQASRSRGKRCC